MANITLTNVKTNSKSPNFYVVRLEGRVIGFLEKYANSRTETHPYKAFGVKLEGASNFPVVDRETPMVPFYAEDGGKKAAIAYLMGRA